MTVGLILCVCLLVIVVSVWFSCYIADCRSSTAVEKVMKKCHGRNRCAVDVEEYVFGNPCPSAIPKYLKVIYTCGKIIIAP